MVFLRPGRRQDRPQATLSTGRFKIQKFKLQIFKFKEHIPELLSCL
jgi:hypothetical protein